MNNKTMQRIAEKVLLQMEIEKLMNVETGKLLDINPGYLSMIKKPDQYDKCPMKAWRKIHDWYNSGMTLAEWYNKRIKESEREDTSEQPDETLGTMNTETIPEVRRTAPPKPEPAPEEGKPPTEQKPPAPIKEKPAAPPPPPRPDFKHETETITVPIDLKINKHVFHPEKPKGKPGRKKDEGKPGRPSQEEIERVLATLGIEIAKVVKLKNKQD